MRSIEEDLQAAAAYHGHLCSGMVLGVRMSRLALQILGIDEPGSFRDLIVYVEMYRCAADAVSVVTGCKLGRRTLKVVDYGKMATTFVNLATHEAVRVAAKNTLFPQPGEDLLTFWKGFEDDEIFQWENVRINISPEDLPGKPIRSVCCELCGEQVLDCRDVMIDNKTVCKACAGQRYYQVLSSKEVANDVGNL